MIEPQTIEKLAELARIKVSREEVEGLRAEIEPILDYVNQIQDAVGAGEIEPEAGAVRNVMRADDHPHESGIHSAELLEEAPAREGEYFKVKKILGGSDVA
ncbi:MAG TPA: Asp-tRNA(Asn)/Glu-tRNA(Gln) amidotransferase subunit GatC [Candidatus Paceibacterota bacterium]|jgi:aspartyl-tRNA(Asn)/glutamyl-tRNA(Gln) amidotransferase subunit C|nr:Asp-tRNA(Asn)/Glu-tRNA(Gln) amidotransferase subunit GatC [Candidatus Paceibacterota bacterium]